MSQPIEALVADLPPAHESRAEAIRTADATTAAGLQLTICEDLDALAAEWRAFEHAADGTVFQTFDWLSLWHRHIGAPAGVRPAIVLGRAHDGKLAFLLPLAVAPGAVRRLTFLGDDLCDYNAPLIAPGFFARAEAADFRALWRDIRGRLQRVPQLKHDLVELTKMPETIGVNANPFLALETRLNPSGAYLTRLAGTWDEFYTAKRSSATRRRDRTKRKRLAEQGEVCLATPHDAAERASTLETLIVQKSKAFARMGVANLFVRPGYREFFLDLASNPRTQELVHISRLDVGPIPAAINLGLMCRGTYYHILASYDDGEVMRFGPGAAHLRDLLQFAIERGCTRFDFTIGDEPYKREWSDTALKLYDHLAVASLRGWPVVMAARGFRRLKRFIKQTPILWRCFSAARGAIAFARGRNRGGGAREDHHDSPSVAPE